VKNGTRGGIFLKKNEADIREEKLDAKEEDIAQLVGEYPVSAALRELTPVQKRVLFMNIVHGIPAKDIAAVLGCSIRNVTKHRQKALEAIRFLVTGEP